MNKTLKVLLAAVALGFGMTSLSHAAGATRGAKTYTSINYSTTVTTVTASGAGVVYGVILGTGSAGTDHTVLWDKAATGATVISTTSGLVAKLIVSSATQNTTIYFDPPLQFNNGIVMANSAATTVSTVIWERGRLPTGY